MSAAGRRARVLVVEARFYGDLADELAAGAAAALDGAGVRRDRLVVPGALEIPAAVGFALGAAAAGVGPAVDGVVALGCVIRGETSHYDIVAGESARKLMDLAVDRGLALGNGILTCDTREQAWRRAARDGGNKGGAAARACLAMLQLRRDLGLAGG